ncbi:hypothetical protein AM493_07705 [Flavobacterium akiainvivens]|uniref:Uncharacterized protein n=1 Tax=Flavobacterium akiainvivens TaxID=1202724 RepID=A0A0M8MGS9_9FLAO|nr:hypothetical protein [Flavobacterium akiainvivens]KOS05931.1 hypothetical protein AM493_07705 [Flavobacterium akiainvivens]SFQ53373.1 hypothetical protein SAMN05444144_10719 [Flavobacterium akiainvivens]
MKYLLLIVVLPLSLFAQGSGPDCGWYGNKTVEQRNALFPFNVAKKVVLVSYPVEPLVVKELATIEGLAAGCLFQGREIIDTLTAEYYGRSTTYYLYEKKQITGAAVDGLSNIMLNYTPNPDKKLPWEPHNCSYWPRNSVLFYDENNSLVANFGICFSCRLLYFSPDEQDPLADAVEYRCPEFIKLLSDFFNANGITYGIKLR